MLLTMLFILTACVGATVLVIEIRSAVRRRRVEQEWRREQRDQHRN
jgi:hypothetical protein